MATIVEHEAQQIEQVDATGRTPVVFIHGLWLLPSSRWARWARVFECADYTPLAPGWPDDFETGEEAKARPEVFAHKTIKQVEAKVDTKNPDRGPLLIISGEKDNTVPWAIANASFKKQQRNNGVTEIIEMSNCGYALTIDNGWREVADTALRFVKRFV